MGFGEISYDVQHFLTRPLPITNWRWRTEETGSECRTCTGVGTNMSYVESHNYYDEHFATRLVLRNRLIWPVGAPGGGTCVYGGIVTRVYRTAVHVPNICPTRTFSVLCPLPHLWAPKIENAPSPHFVTSGGTLFCHFSSNSRVGDIFNVCGGAWRAYSQVVFSYMTIYSSVVYEYPYYSV